MSAPEAVVRIAHRRARPGCAPAYEEVVRAMFADARKYPGFLGAELIPPKHDGEEYRVVTRFASEADLARWNDSPERAEWHARMRPLA
ncbi:MAG: antibiotic biosynthesis monooxygenase, partial [Zoogloea sp.]|nr:antibiotic biosynthesis monooxygenase [Zoogloea sp.]